MKNRLSAAEVGLVFSGWLGHTYPGATFLVKVDPNNGGSAHLVLSMEELTPGETIPTHRYPGSDEIRFVEVIHNRSLPRTTQASTTLVLARAYELADQRGARDRTDRPHGEGGVMIG